VGRGVAALNGTDLLVDYSPWLVGNTVDVVAGRLAARHDTLLNLDYGTLAAALYFVHYSTYITTIGMGTAPATSYVTGTIRLTRATSAVRYKVEFYLFFAVGFVYQVST
jgi:hypothetical protein